MVLTPAQSGGPLRNFFPASTFLICETCKQRIFDGDAVAVVKHGSISIGSTSPICVKHPTELYFFHESCKQFLTRKGAEKDGAPVEVVAEEKKEAEESQGVGGEVK